MLGGGGIGEHEASAVTGGGGIAEQVTAVCGGGTDEQDARAVAGGGGIGEHEASAVSGGGGIAEHEASAVTGAGGIAEHEASAVTAAAVSTNSPAPYSAAAGYVIPNGPGGEPAPTRLRSHGTSYPYSAADGPSGHCPGGQKPPPSHTGPFPSAPCARLPALLRTGSPAQSVPVRSAALPAGAPVVRPGGIAGHLARAAGEVLASLIN